MKNILEMLEAAAERLPEKTAFADDKVDIKYGELVESAKAAGSRIAETGMRNRPVAVLTQRGAPCMKVMMGVLYSGNFYVIIDPEMPAERADKILKTLEAELIVCDEANRENAKKLDFSGSCLIAEEITAGTADNELLDGVRKRMIDTDPAYAIFTSGSTGNPKGVVVNHRSVLAYSKWAVDAFAFDENTVFGNQTPFYFSMSVTDIFTTLRTGASMHIIPKQYFSFPMLLMQFLNERKVNTIYWVPSALSIVANLKVLDYVMAKYIEKVLFAGEVMPAKQLNYWRSKYPEALFANLFGPTETTDICTYYVVDRAISDSESVPIGIACDNCDSFVVTDDGRLAGVGEEGELYARGSFLAMGYYNDPEKTAAAFVQNPLNPHYPERVYKTGDLVRWNERGELIYISRRDFQIKHMGYRIELGEIEAAATAVEGVGVSVCIYDGERDALILVYVGSRVKEEEMQKALAASLPAYMMPQRVIKTNSVPYNQNGKTDRKKLAQIYNEEIKEK